MKRPTSIPPEGAVRKRRGRFARCGVRGLEDAAPARARPRIYDDLTRVAVVAAATQAPPAATWSHRAIAEQVAGTVFAAVPPSHVGRAVTPGKE